MAVIDIVDAHIDGAVGPESVAGRFEFAVEIGCQVKPVVVGHPVIVASLIMGQCSERRLSVVAAAIILGVFRGHGVGLFGKGGGVAGGIDPRGTDIAAVAELVVEHNTQIVPPVILGRERLAIIDNLVFAVEEAHGAAPRVADPAGETADVALRQQLETIAPPTAGIDEAFPILT